MSDFKVPRSHCEQHSESDKQVSYSEGATSHPGGWFKTTHWTVVLDATRGDSTQARVALAKLCQTYWYPLYVFVRRRGLSSEDAEDLVQGFFARLIEKDYLKKVDSERGKFRSFLLTALKGFLANEWDRANCQKRGGGRQIVSLDAKTTESRYVAEPMDEATPEKAFERRWAITVLDQVLNRLEAEFSDAGKGRLFDECIDVEARKQRTKRV